jgi:GTP pyrophosphokinase
VKGYVTRGRGVTVHREDCSNLKHYEEAEPDRLVAARWTPEDEGQYNALVAVESNDRVGLLSEVTTLIAAKKVNISGVNTYPLRHNRARLNIAVTITSRDQLDDLMASLAAIQGVTGVHRV